MKTKMRMAATGVIAGLLTMVAASVASAQTGLMHARPLTPQEIEAYALPAGTQVSGGLLTVGLGQPVYLEALVTTAVQASNILGVTWTLTNRPIGSSAALATSPLGTNVPIYSPADRDVFRLAGRRLLRPDVAGQYVVIATVNTNGGSLVVTGRVSGSMYLGLQVCGFCHSGGAFAADKYTPYTNTAHASFFKRAIDGLESTFYSRSCISCHVVGYDTNALAVNGGFDDIATQAGWTFPSVLTNGNWAAMPAELKNVANIQCENCHGAGSEHAYAFGNTNLSNWPRISINYNSGDCAQCHEDQPYYYKSLEWYNSRHAIATRYPTGESRASCVRCHSGIGFIDYVNGTTPPRTGYEAVTCSACHDPHNAANPHQLRKMNAVTLMDGFTTITNGGMGLLCMNCHLGRQNATNYVETATGGSQFGPHHGPQADMLAGANAITYGKLIPSSSHREVVTNACVTCHLQEVASGDPGFLEAGGHTFRPGWDGGTPNDPSDDVHLTESCTQCHGEVESFDFARQDYDGDGILEGVQTEVKGLLGRLAFLLPPVGTPKADITITTNWSRQQLRSGFNYRFVQEDGSFGVHNLSYAVGLLKASIADLSGDANDDGLPDTWQIAQFGSITNINAAPNACPAGDGVPNWLKYALGLDPWVAGQSAPDGVVWVNGDTIGGGTNTIHIYTAAEVAFDTEVGKSYQIQSVSSPSGGWQNVGDPIAGTGSAISYVTTMRENVQQYYRVLHTP